MEVAGKGKGKSKPPAARCTSQQHCMRQRTFFRVTRQPLSQCFLTDCLHEHFCHGSKIAGINLPTASIANRHANLALEH